MIIYGWNTRVLKEAPFKGEECANCHGNERYIVVTGSYAHVFWIPFFPYKKELQIGCLSCDHLATINSVSPEFKELAKQLKSKVKIPWYFYSGLILIALIIGLFSYQGARQKAEYKSYLETAQEDDIITLYDSNEPTEYKYYLWKVIGADIDSVRVAPNSFQYDRIPSKLDIEDGFYDIFYTLHKTYLLELYDEGSIKKVQRGLGFGTSFSREIPYELDSLNTDSF